LDAFIRQDQVLDVTRAVAGIFRDSDELRKNRAKARLKFLFIAQGWTAASFLDEVHRRLGYRLDPAVDDAPVSGAYRDHLGIHRQRQPNLYYAGFSVTSGRTSPSQLEALAGLADRYGQGRLRNTALQNIIVLDIPAHRLDDFRREAAAAVAGTGATLEGAAFQRGMVSCTGSQYCKLAVTETKEFSIALAAQLDTRLPGFSQAIQVHIAGCPNACGQHYIADVGLQGVQVPAGDGGTTDGFDFFVGGGLGAHAAFARRVGFRVAAAQVPDALHRLLLGYLAEREEGEQFHDWAGRVEDAHVKALLTADTT
jgi:sulfite reductase (ferredoxin)